MTPDQFRALALSLPDAVEASHMNHPDFRVGGKIFATLGYPSRDWGVIVLTPTEQSLLCQTEPETFVSVKGGWGRSGGTQVHLPSARVGSVRTALRAAWKRRSEAPVSTRKRAAASRKRVASKPAPRRPRSGGR